MVDCIDNPLKPFTAGQELVWSELSGKLKSGTDGPQFPEVERREVEKVVGLATERWYACSCGFVYAIGECGAAYQASFFS